MWQAFLQLSRRRQSGWTPNPISISDIYSWLSLNGVEDFAVRLEYYELIVRLDETWLDYAREQDESNRVPNKEGGKADADRS